MQPTSNKPQISHNPHYNIEQTKNFGTQTNEGLLFQHNKKDLDLAELEMVLNSTDLVNTKSLQKSVQTFITSYNLSNILELLDKIIVNSSGDYLLRAQHFLTDILEEAVNDKKLLASIKIEGGQEQAYKRLDILYKILIDHASPLAAYKLAYLYETGKLPAIKPDLKQAMEYYKLSINFCSKNNPNHAGGDIGESWYRLGKCNEQLGNTTEATVCYKTAKNNGSTSAFSALGAILMLKPATQGEAEQLFKEAVKREDAFGAYNLGVMYHHKNPKLAKEMYLQAIKFNPEHPQAHGNLGSMLYAEGRVAESLKHLKKASDGNDYNAMFVLAQIYLYDQNKPQEGLQLLQRASKAGHLQATQMLQNM